MSTVVEKPKKSNIRLFFSNFFGNDGIEVSDDKDLSDYIKHGNSETARIARELEASRNKIETISTAERLNVKVRRANKKMEPETKDSDGKEEITKSMTEELDGREI